MKTRKPAGRTPALLATKGSAAPSSTNRESLGPDSVAKVAAAARRSPAKTGQKDRVNLSVRLDPARHRRLKLAAVDLGDTAQGVMIAALDAYLEQVGDDAAVPGRFAPDADRTMRPAKMNGSRSDTGGKDT